MTCSECQQDVSRLYEVPGSLWASLMCKRCRRNLIRRARRNPCGEDWCVCSEEGKQ
jgi:hypothetical protein